MKRLAAFTFIEMTVAMVLSSLIIGIAGFAIASANQSLRAARERYSETAELLQLQVLLNRDCMNATRARFQHDELHMLRIDKTILHYTFEQDLIIRSLENNRDTFRMDIQNLVPVFLENQPPNIESIEIQLVTRSGMDYTLSAFINYSNQDKYMITENQDFYGY